MLVVFPSHSLGTSEGLSQKDLQGRISRSAAVPFGERAGSLVSRQEDAQPLLEIVHAAAGNPDRLETELLELRRGLGASAGSVSRSPALQTPVAPISATHRS